MHNNFWQYCLPQHFFSRLVGLFAESRNEALKNWLIKKFIRLYKVDLSIAEKSDPNAYNTFNEFFTRALKQDARSIVSGEQEIACPVDGSISQIGDIKNSQLIQAKNHNYSLQELLAGNNQLAQEFNNGQFTTLYLGPKDYHRVHMPLKGTLQSMIYVPGKLFSVSNSTADSIPNLFARNERVVCSFDTIAGPMVMVLVGAMLVASIETVWAGVVTPQKKRRVESWDYTSENIVIEKGEEMGRFQFGSTVILLFAENVISWEQDLCCGSDVLLGQHIATCNER